MENEAEHSVSFAPVDGRLVFHGPGGNEEKICDALLFYTATIIFVELKERSGKGRQWISEGDAQLRSTIARFETSAAASGFTVKRAYIANRKRPNFRSSQAERMERFFAETGYVLRIENRIRLGKFA